MIRQNQIVEWEEPTVAGLGGIPWEDLDEVVPTIIVNPFGLGNFST